MDAPSCLACGASLEGTRQKKFCANNGVCKMRWHRGARVVPMRPEGEQASSDVESATRGELEAAGRDGTHLGRLALSLAARIDEGRGTDQGYAALAKELRAVMVEALKGAGETVDPVDELRRLRDRKRNAG